MKTKITALTFAAAVALLAIFPYISDAATKVKATECCAQQSSCCATEEACCQ